MASRCLRYRDDYYLFVILVEVTFYIIKENMFKLGLFFKLNGYIRIVINLENTSDSPAPLGLIPTYIHTLLHTF